MMKSFITGIIILCMSSTAQGQFYYQDIYSTLQTVKEHTQYRKNHVRKLILRSMEPNGAVNKDFHCEKIFSKDYLITTTTTGSFQTGATTLTVTFNEKGLVIRSVDSTTASVNTTLYQYDSSGRVALLHFSSHSGDQAAFNYDEEHIYKYDNKGVLSQMIRKKGGKKYSVIIFKTDSAGHITEEQEQGPGIASPDVFYKYDEAGRLTDIYRYNAARGKMLPDYLFSYDKQGRLSERLVVSMDSGDYNNWKYAYNEKGLIDHETCFGKKNRSKGTIQFQYDF